MNVVDKIRYSGLKEDVADFAVGDGVKVYVKIVEGTTERIQLFAGTVIARVDEIRRLAPGLGGEITKGEHPGAHHEMDEFLLIGHDLSLRLSLKCPLMF